MRLLIVFARAYPWRVGLMLGCLVLAALAEGLGLSSILPLVSMVAERQQGAAESAVSHTVATALGLLGLEPTLGVLLATIVAAMFLKAAPSRDRRRTDACSARPPSRLLVAD